MDKQTFIDQSVAKARASCFGSRARLSFNPSAVAEHAAALYEYQHSPAGIAEEKKREFLRRLVEVGGKAWEGKRVYFNDIKDPDSNYGCTFSFYIDTATEQIRGVTSQQQLTVATAIVASAR